MQNAQRFFRLAFLDRTIIRAPNHKLIYLEFQESVLRLVKKGIVMCTHISLLLPNRPGEFYKVAELLGQNEINVLGYKLTSQGNSGLLHILCSNANLAYNVLFQRYRYYCNSSSVLICPAAHEPGALLKVLAVLDEKELNVENSYQATNSDGKIIVVFELIDREQTGLAESYLRDSGVDVLEVQPQ